MQMCDSPCDALFLVVNLSFLCFRKLFFGFLHITDLVRRMAATLIQDVHIKLCYQTAGVRGDSVGASRSYESLFNSCHEGARCSGCYPNPFLLSLLTTGKC